MLFRSPLSLAQNVRESSLSVRTQRHRSSGHTYIYGLSVKFVRCFRFKFSGDALCGVRPIEFVRVRIASLRDDVSHLFSSLQKLIERLEFQSEILSENRAEV